MLELTGDHIRRLNDEDLRTLIFSLAEAELRRHGRPISGLTAGGNQTDADGGVDVRVALEGTEATLDFIKRPATGFQCKCEDMPATAILKEMRPHGELRPSIKALIAERGAYIIVSSQGSTSDSSLRRRVEAMRGAVADEPDADGLMLDFYDRTRLANWARAYPGVEMWVRERINDKLGGWQSCSAWIATLKGSPYLHDDTGRVIAKTSDSAEAMSAAAGIDAIRHKLRSPGSSVRLVGLSGTGKTRMVQALFEAGVGISSPLDPEVAIYTDIGHSPEPTARDMLIRLVAQEQRAILIVDNCNPATHRNLTEVLGRGTEHVSLITVEYDVQDDEIEATDVFVLSTASDAVVDDLIHLLTPHISLTDRHRIVEFSGGNARVALALARTVKAGATLGTLNDSDLFRRLFVQTQADSDELLRAAEAVSLVYSFDGTDLSTETGELSALSAIAECSPRALFRLVATLQERDLVQSRGRWRALLPPALANRLARTALKNNPPSVVLDAIIPQGRLLKSFSRRLSCLTDSPEACGIAERWLRDEGMLADPARLNELGTALFFNLAPLVPEQALATLERTLQTQNVKAFIAAHVTTYWQWVGLLRNLAYEVEHFERAARLILALAIAESPDDRRQDANEAWKELFHVVLSGTLAPPADRVAFLRRLAVDADPNIQRLALVGIGSTLRSGFFSASHNFSFGARSRGTGWEPRTNEELLEWYDAALGLVRTFGGRDSQHCAAVRLALASHFRHLWQHEDLRDRLIQLSRELAVGGWPSGWAAVRNSLRYDGAGMTNPGRPALLELLKLLAPTDLAEQIRSYALGEIWSPLDVADSEDADDAAEEANPVSAHERVVNKVVGMGQALAADPDTFDAVLVEAIRTPNGRQFHLGIGLGKASDTPEVHWAAIHQAFAEADASQRNFNLLAGFVRGLREANPAQAEELLERLVNDPVLGRIFPLIQGWPWNDAGGDRLLRSLRQSQANLMQFNAVLAGRDGDGLSLQKYCEVLDGVSDLPNGLPAAIDSLSMDFHRLKTAKEEMPGQLIQLGRSLLVKYDFQSPSQNLAYRLTEVAKIVFKGEEAAPEVHRFAERFAHALDDYRTHADSLGDLAAVLFHLHPSIALDAFLTGPRRRQLFAMRYRLEGSEQTVVNRASDEALLAWAAIAPQERLPLLGAEIQILDRSNPEDAKLTDLATRLLEMAPQKKRVLDAFARHFHPNGWSGSLEQTLRPHMTLATNLAGSPDPEIAAWAATQLDSMRRRIDGEKKLERGAEQKFE
ncbi:MAG: hypothetical protein KF892_03975 [Rhizobacter sp.]|nr:hypothetical protein [Rhizobacter sp.]